MSTNRAGLKHRILLPAVQQVREAARKVDLRVAPATDWFADTSQTWIARRHHNGTANYLYLDGHARTMSVSNTFVDMYPDTYILKTDGTYP